jgi:predicted CoA-substrate-specific enzyme activase
MPVAAPFGSAPGAFDLHSALSALAVFRDSRRSHPSEAADTYFSSAEEKAAFIERHRHPQPPGCNYKRGDSLRVYLGIDAGSTTSKFVLIDEDENLVDSFYSGNKGEPLRVIKAALVALKKKYDEAGINLEIIAVGTTGYGELLFDKAFGADYHTVETVAHAAAAQKYAPGVSFILDIGGQDMKAISITNGIVTNITLNEACSSGCGSFLENFAANLHIPVDKIAEAAFNAKNPAELGSRCTVFMNSTIITEQKNGKQADDIMAGLCRSIIENVFTKVVRITNLSSLGDKVVVQGGTFKNDAVLRALEQYLGKEVIRPPYPGEMGAIGVALLAKRQVCENGYTSPHSPSDRSRFIGFDAIAGFDYTQEANVRCPFCANKCDRTLVTFSSGQTWVTGNRCVRGELLDDPDDAALNKKLKSINEGIDAIPDMIKIRERLLFKDYPFTSLCPDRNITVGLPRALDFWRNMPFFTTFFHALGFKTRISRPSSRKLFESGLPFVASDTVCFPAKLVHGHIHDLAAAPADGEKSVDRIFMPMLAHLPSDNPEPKSTYTCPVLKGYPLVVKYSDDPRRRWNIPFDTPVFHWFKSRDRDFQLCRYMNETFGIAEGDCRKAITRGDESMAAFNGALRAEGERILSDLEKKRALGGSGGTDFAVVISGRHYQFDVLVNHQLSQYFVALGIPVLTVDSLPGVQEVDLSKTMLDITNNSHARLLAGAIIAAEHPALEYVEIFSFGCGHDALYTDEVARIMTTISGKSPLILKLDESDVAGPLRIRIRSFIETVRARRALPEGSTPIMPLGEPYAVKFRKADKKNKTILVPNVSESFCKIVSAALQQHGLKAEALPLGGKEAMSLGKKYVHNDSCFPAQMIIGEAIAALKSGRYKPDEVVIGTGKTTCDCRLTNYMALTRNALDQAGFDNVPILSTDFSDMKNLHPAFRFTPITYARIAWCMVMSDVLNGLCHKIRPYERNKGESDRIFKQSIDAIATGLKSRGMRGAFKEYEKAVSDMSAIRYDRTVKKPLVFITGEYLQTFHPGANFYIEEYLENNGMETELPRMFDIYRNLMLFHTVSELKDFNVHHPLFDTIYAVLGDKYADIAISMMERVAQRHPLYEPGLRLPEMAKISDHVIHHSIQSGEGFLMAADILHHAQQGVQSFVIVQPFGCLPNHACGRGIIKKVKEEYPAIQILPLDYDPDTSFANIENRLQMLIMNARSFRTEERPNQAV